VLGGDGTEEAVEVVSSEGGGMSWRDTAACRDADPDLFFPPDGRHGYATGWDPRPAKQVCSGCQVLEPCLTYAMRTSIVYGVWGGLDPDERDAMAKAGQRRRRR
jgi:WhiB family transcriptional regulator, redox-sensing transcriptional regulator